MSGDHPVAGVGLAGFPTEAKNYVREPGNLQFVRLIVDQPHVTHNVYLQQLAETGIVGLALLLAVIGACLAAAERAARRFEALGERALATLARAVGRRDVGFLTASLFISNSTDKRLWIVLALGPALLGAASSPHASSAPSTNRDRLAHAACPAVRGELRLVTLATAGPQAPRSSRSPSSGASAAARSPGAGGSATSIPVLPSTTSSPIPPTSVATTGTEHAIASMIAVGSASERDGCRSTSAASSVGHHVRPIAGEHDAIAERGGRRARSARAAGRRRPRAGAARGSGAAAGARRRARRRAPSRDAATTRIATTRSSAREAELGAHALARPRLRHGRRCRCAARRRDPDDRRPTRGMRGARSRRPR